MRERVAFISYSASDDELSDGALLGLRGRIHSELQINSAARFGSGRTGARTAGAHWEALLRNAVAASEFFILIVTPAAIASESCGLEYRCFLERESALRREDLIFPLLYVDVPGLSADDLPPHDPRMRLIVERGWFDWRELVISPSVRRRWRGAPPNSAARSSRS